MVNFGKPGVSNFGQFWLFNPAKGLFKDLRIIPGTIWLGLDTGSGENNNLELAPILPGLNVNL